MARDFSSEPRRKPREILQICIIWVGFCLDAEFEYHKKIVDSKTEFIKEVGSDQSRYFKWLELTCEGEPICINEYATLIAEENQVHVLQLDDYQAEMTSVIDKAHINFENDWYELVLDQR